MRFVFFLFPLLSILTWSCNTFSDLEDIDVPGYEAEFAFPLINSTVSVQDLLEEFDNLATAILVDSNGLLHFQYRGDLLTRTSEQIFGSINEALPPLIPLLSDTLLLPLTLPNGVQLDRVDLKAGNFIYYAENPHPQPVSVTLTIPELQRQGQPFQIQFQLAPYSGSGPRPSATNSGMPASLSGYVFHPANGAIRITAQALTPGGEKVTLKPFVVQFGNLAFSYAEGFFGQQLYKGEEDTVRIDFFDTRYIQGNIRFADPRVTFFFENSLGVPTRAVVKFFDIFTVTGDKLAVESPFIQSGIDFPYPALNEVGQLKKSTFSFTKLNSNVDDLLNSGPTSVAYDVDALTHPDGNTAQRGFVTDKSFYRIQVEIDLPLEGKISQFAAEEDFNIDLQDLGDAHKIEFKMVADNGIPLDLDVQAYFLDENQTTIDSLLSSRQRLIRGAPVNASGIPARAEVTTTFLNFEGARLQRILKAKQLRVNVFFSSENNPDKDIKILSNQDLNFRLGARAVLKSE